MSAPRWATALLRRLAAPDEADVLIGDLEEAHRARVARRGAVVAALLTSLETADVALMLLRKRVRLPRSGLSWLDFKLGVRMLVRYPVLTLVGSGSLALAIAIGATAFAFISLMLWPRMPLPDGDQVVIVQHYDRAANAPESRVVADFLRWRGGTGTLGDVAAGRGRARNIRMGDGIVEPISVAEVTASTFAMTRVAPILGRTLTDADASAAAPPVIVIGERIWRERFARRSRPPRRAGARQRRADGRRGRDAGGVQVPVGLRGVAAAQDRRRAVKPRAGMGITIWARMKPSVTPAQANAELAVLSAQAAADWPATHAHLIADVQPVAVSDIGNPEERTLLAFDEHRRRAAGAGRERQRRAVDVRPRRHARIGDRRPHRARREPRPARRSVRRGGARAEHDRGDRWA